MSDIIFHRATNEAEVDILSLRINYPKDQQLVLLSQGRPFQLLPQFQTCQLTELCFLYSVDLLYNSSREWLNSAMPRSCRTLIYNLSFFPHFFSLPCFAIRSDWKIASWSGKISSHVSSSTEEEEKEEMVKKVHTVDWAAGKLPLLQFLHIYTPVPSS